MIKKIGWIGFLLALVSCGSSANKMTGTGGTGGTGTDGGACTISTGLGSPNSGSMTWKDDGTSVCGFLALVDRYTTTLTDTIEIDVSTLASQSVDIVLSSYSGQLGGTYSCQPGNGTTAPNVMFAYVGTHGGGPAAMSQCAVTIGFSEDSHGTQHAQGTFSGTVASDAIDGGSYAITDGMFDLTVTLNGG